MPDELDLDRGAVTTLQDEYLTNSDGDLEIVKVFNCSVQKVAPPSVFANAFHPNAAGVLDLLHKSNSQLKNLIREQSLEDQCQQNNNPSMRQALYNAALDLQLSEREIPLNKEDAKNIWEAVRRSLPVYALFRSDRASNDQDPEVQNPMKAAIKSALAGLGEELDAIARQVEQVAGETAHRTLEQLRRSYPDMDLASALEPKFRKPNWGMVFKLDLQSDDQIPLNKRGSGIRRLILLSFFQAEAERLQEERRAGRENRLPIIYAVEEPETSQHPDSQERIVRAFEQVAELGDQVLLTTHVPGLAGLLPLDSLRFVDADAENGHVRVRGGSSDVVAEIADTLGVLPAAFDKPVAHVAVAVEGPTDIDALISFSLVLAEGGHLEDFDHTKVFWTIGGGQTLNDWVERRYLDRLGIPQIYLFDSDCAAPNTPPSQKKLDRVAEIERRPMCKGFLSKKRTIENYVHPDAVSRLSQGKIELGNELDLDYDDLAAAFRTTFEAAKIAHGKALGFFPVDHERKRLSMSSANNNCKKILTAYIMRNMTVDEVMARGRYTTPEGEEGNEILEWLDSIRVHI